MSGWGGPVMIETCILYFLGVGGAGVCVFYSLSVWIGKYEHTVFTYQLGWDGENVSIGGC